MKKLLFLYPIEEYMEFIWRHNPEMYDILNKIIDNRYRKNGYQIVYVTFKNKTIFGVNIDINDRVIETDITFEEHTTPIGKDEKNKNIYKYSSAEHLQISLGHFDELVICGFHAQDCVMMIAEHFYKLNNSTIIDEELTDFLGPLSKRFYFNIGKYNLANRLLYDKAEDMLMYGKEFMINFLHYKERYTKPYFHVDGFKADFTLDECMTKLTEIEEKRKLK